MAVAYVKEIATATNTGTTTTFNIALAANPVAGNTVMVLMRCSPSTVPPYQASFTDSKSNTWTVDFEYKENNQYLIIATTHQNAGTLTTSDTITFTLDQVRNSGGYPTFVWVEEFSGILPLNATDSASGTNNSTATTQLSSTVTPTQNADLVVAFNDTQSATVTETLNGTGTVGTYLAFTTTNLSSAPSNPRRSYPAYQILATGSGTAEKHAWTLSAGIWSDMLIGLYKAAPASGLKNSVGILSG